MESISIGNRIKNRRRELGKTQLEVSKKASISRSYYADVEADRYSPSTETLQKIAEALQSSVSYLLTGTKTIDDDLTKEEIFSLSKKLTSKKISNLDDFNYYDLNVIDFDKFKNPIDLLKTIILKNKIENKYIQFLFDDKGDFITINQLKEITTTFNDKDIKILSTNLSDDIYEQLLIHYYLCKYLLIDSDISKFGSNEKNNYLSILRQNYLFEKHNEKSINISTDEFFFDGKTIIVNGKKLNKDDSELLLNIIKRF